MDHGLWDSLEFISVVGLCISIQKMNSNKYHHLGPPLSSSSHHLGPQNLEATTNSVGKCFHRAETNASMYVISCISVQGILEAIVL